MNVVDSSGWPEYFAGGSNAGFFAAAIENVEQLIVPAVSIYEVFKRVLQQRDKDAALAVIAIMSQSVVVDLDTTLALSAATLSHMLKLAMADSIILATTRAYGATLWTQDAHFAGIDNVNYQAAI